MNKVMKMMKASGAICLMMGLSATASAQRLPLDIGVNVGTNLNFMNINGEKPSVGLLPGYQVGLFGQITPSSLVGKYVSFHAGLMYVNTVRQQCGTATLAPTIDGGSATTGSGCSLSETPAAGRMVLKTTNGYVMAPVTFNLKPFKGFSLNLGAQYNRLLSSIAEGRAALQGANGSVNVQSLAYDYLTDQPGQTGAYSTLVDSTGRPRALSGGGLFNRNDFALNLGFSIQLTKRLGIDLRTNYGLTDAVNDLYQSRIGIASTNRNVTGQLNITYVLFGKSVKKKAEKEE